MYSAIVIGTSAGGLNALTVILSRLPADFPLPIIVVQHRAKDNNELLEEVLQTKCDLNLKQVDEKEMIRKGFIYIAPPDYHLMIEPDGSFSLNSDVPINFSRPSIDVLFESAAEVYGKKLIGIILTGANHDGAMGIKDISHFGGLTIAQDPEEASFPEMPLTAIGTGGISKVLTLKGIAEFLLDLKVYEAG